MNFRKHAFCLASLTIALATALPAFAHEHEGDLIVGRNSARELAIEFDFGDTHALPAVSGLLEGFASNAPGFDHLAADEPAEDFYMLETGAAIRFEVISFSPAFKAWTPGLGAALQNPGDFFDFPDGPALHAHLNWHIDSTDPAFDMGDSPWTASFQLVDTGTTGYDPSPIYTMTFTPEPSSLIALALGAVALLRRRAAARA